MLGPFMFPKAFIITLVVLPICIHVVEQSICPSSRENPGDIGVGTARITVCIISTITMVWPEDFLAGQKAEAGLLDAP